MFIFCLIASSGFKFLYFQVNGIIYGQKGSYSVAVDEIRCVLVFHDGNGRNIFGH